MIEIKKAAGRPTGSKDSFKRVKATKYDTGTKTMWVRLTDDKFELIRLAKIHGLSAADIFDYALGRLITNSKGLQTLKYKGKDVASK